MNRGAEARAEFDAADELSCHCTAAGMLLVSRRQLRYRVDTMLYRLSRAITLEEAMPRSRRPRRFRDAMRRLAIRLHDLPGRHFSLASCPPDQRLPGLPRRVTCANFIA